MNKTAYVLVAIIMALTAHAQNFEGKIMYQNKFKSKLPNVTDEQFENMMGTTQAYYIKNNKYKSVMNGQLVQWQLYMPAENKIYNKMSNSEVLFWDDASENKDSVLKAEIIKNADTVLGYPCNELVLTCTSGLQKYYYNAALPVDASLYTNHHFGNWYEVVSRIHALPLKEVIDNTQFTFVSVATSIAPMQVESNLFALPADAKTMKSPY